MLRRQIYKVYANDIIDFFMARWPCQSQFAAETRLGLKDLIVNECLTGVCVLASSSRTGKLRHVMAAGLSGFLADAYVNELLTSPPSDIAMDILNRSRDRGSPLLSYDDVAHANAHDGLNLFPLAWAQQMPAGDGGDGDELAVLRMQAFLDLHKGYRLKRVLKQASRVEEGSLVHAGFLRISPGDAGTSAKERLLFGLDRAQAQAAEFSSAIGLLFTARTPRLGFNRKQQQVLSAAIDDLSDEETADVLCISTHTVNMRWRTIYDNLRDRPEISISILNISSDGLPSQHLQKRRRLISFLRSHPEELRPYSR